MDSMARSLISKSESYYLDLFLFCFYYGGMAPIDTAYSRHAPDTRTAIRVSL